MTRKTIESLIGQVLGELRSFKQQTENDLADIKKDISSLKNDVSELKDFRSETNNRLHKMENFMKRESVIIENELNHKMMDHLTKTFHGYNIEKYDDKLKSIRNPYTKQKLTEFDGLFLLTFRSTSNMPEHRLFVLVEAKRFTTLDKVKDKIKQWTTLKDLTELARDPKNVSGKFMQTVKAHKLDKISGVYLYIGGPIWEYQALETVEKIVNEEKNHYIGYIKPSGSRYSIKDHVSYLQNVGT